MPSTPDLGGEVSEVPEGFDDPGGSRGAGVVDGIDAEKNVARPDDFSVGEPEGQEDGVARRDVGDGDSAGHFSSGAVLGDGDVGGERGATEGAQVYMRDSVLGDAKRLGDALGCFEFDRMALPIVERKGITLEAFASGEGEGGGGIESATEETNRFGHLQFLRQKVGKEDAEKGKMSRLDIAIRRLK